jgi:hypothetical protein
MGSIVSGKKNETSLGLKFPKIITEDRKFMQEIGSQKSEIGSQTSHIRPLNSDF